LIRWIEVEGVRNLDDQRVAFASGLNVVSGRNAQGKSSLLEAIYLLGTTRSFRTERPEQAVCHGAPHLTVRGEAVRGAVPVLLALRLGPGVRETRVAGEPTDLEAYLGSLDVVAFSSRTVRILVAAPVERRRFLDRGAVLLGVGHLRALRDFRRALAQRNQLLRDLAGRNYPLERARSLLQPWDAAVARAGATVATGRAAFAGALAEKVPEVPDRLLPEKDELEVAYRPGAGYDAQDPEACGPTLERRLADRLSEDLRLGYTVTGPQRDDLVLRTGGRDLLTFGSSGQLRATLIALLLAQVEIIRERKGGCPVLLLDDVDLDIDAGRYATLMGWLEGYDQAVVATAKGGHPDDSTGRRIVMVAGRAHEAA
jgi:DNA replication and repair protein RecF